MQAPCCLELASTRSCSLSQPELLKSRVSIIPQRQNETNFSSGLAYWNWHHFEKQSKNEKKNTKTFKWVLCRFLVSHHNCAVLGVCWYILTWERFMFINVLKYTFYTFLENDNGIWNQLESYCIILFRAWSITIERHNGHRVEDSLDIINVNDMIERGSF